MTITKVWFENEHIFIETNMGEKISTPLCWYKRLIDATEQQLNNFEISPFGIHWEELDEDLSLEGFLKFKPNNVLK